jgi:hypothetical protein
LGVYEGGGVEGEKGTEKEEKEGFAQSSQYSSIQSTFLPCSLFNSSRDFSLLY